MADSGESWSIAESERIGRLYPESSVFALRHAITCALEKATEVAVEVGLQKHAQGGDAATTAALIHAKIRALMGPK